jgi:large subunit ribosomal protein L24
MVKFKIGDTVKITSGKDKGRDGKIEKVLSKGSKVLLPGINMYKKHVKGNSQTNQKGGIFDLPRPLSVAKIALMCPKCKKTTRVGLRKIENDKVRVCKKCGKEIDTK